MYQPVLSGDVSNVPFGYTMRTEASDILHLYAGKRRLPSVAQIGPLEFEPPMLTEGLGAGTNRGSESSTVVGGLFRRMVREFSGLKYSQFQHSILVQCLKKSVLHAFLLGLYTQHFSCFPKTSHWCPKRSPTATDG